MTFQEDDEVVISGIGGKFPEAENVVELAEKLFAGENLMTKDVRKLTKGFYENFPDHHGKTTNNSVMFDNTFFGISPIVSATMDPLTCQILQRTFEAIIDAGINPSELRGSNASVFSGTCISDSDLEWAPASNTGYGIMGKNRCMNSNRVSYWLDLNGTSVSIDNGWTNGIANLYLGWRAIKSGKCDIALVNTANLQWHPVITMQFKDMGLLSPDGFCKTFDDSANGFGRSSAVVVLVLQRASTARRCYATIGHIYSTCYGDREGVISKPTQREWQQLFTEFYSQSKIDVKDVQYIEAHGSSSKEDDAEELNAINEVFCKDRETPLLVGCVKSNLGHAEASSAFCGIAKSLISLENGVIPQNLHYKHPNTLCPALSRGQIKIVDKNTTIIPEGWIGVNCHGFGGTYAHVVLKANQRRKTVQNDGIPRLVLLADRTNDFMADLLEKVESLPFDPEFVSLLHEIHSRRIEKYLGRGYTILPRSGNSVHEHRDYDGTKRPLWFIFSGMGSQWSGMGKRLMDLPIFKESIQRSHNLLADKGLDLINIITTDNPNIFDNILHSFVGIAAIQVALVDVMRALNINPDGFIGHSVGELGCAYADNCFTAEQMVLAAYYRGKASVETELIKGSMAAVGKGYNDIKDHLPDGIEVACHNSEDSCTLSGPEDLIHKFVAELKEQGIFARSVNVANIAYHSRYIRPAAPKLFAYLKQVVQNPKLRSSKWISTSNEESKWDTEVAKYCSAEYHTNNLLSSVLFEEGSKHIPKNAICVEIAPHGLLQAILKRSLGEDVINIPLTSRSAADPLVFLLQAIGKMYMAGVNPCIVNLYPKVQYPVSRGTHMLHHLVHWNEQPSNVVITAMEKKAVYSFKKRLVDVADDGTGYIVNGQNIYPVSLFLALAWDIFASFQKIPTEDCPIVIEDFCLKHPLPVHLSQDDNIMITFERGSGRFEISADHLLAAGTVSMLKKQSSSGVSSPSFTPDLEGIEIYNEIKRNGIDIGEHFKSLSAVKFDDEVIQGKVPLKLNWVQSIESLFQLYLLKAECSLDFIELPSAFERLEISCIEHNQCRNSLNDIGSLNASYDIITNTATCGGISIRGLKGFMIPRVKSALKFLSTKFIPFLNPPMESSLRFADFCFSVFLNNIFASDNPRVVDVVEVIEPNQTSFVGLYLQQTFVDFKIKFRTVSNPSNAIENSVDFIITPSNFLQQCSDLLTDGGFVLVKSNPSTVIPFGFSLIGKFQQNSNEEFLLLKKFQDKTKPQEMKFLTIDENQSQVANALRELKPTAEIVYVVMYKEPAEGLESFKKQMQKETPLQLRWVFILDSKAPRFDSKNSFYSEQLTKGLRMNVYKNGCWGACYQYNFSDSAFQNEVNLSLELAKEITPTYVCFDLERDLLNLEQVEYSGKINDVKLMGVSKLLQHKKIIWDKYLTWSVPESWSLEDAVTVPVSYALAYYCLTIIWKTEKVENVLVTNGTSCIGRASIAVALSVAGRVFVTVNNAEEVTLIRKIFPQLRESDVITHENTRFDLHLKLIMKKAFAHVIINSLEGERFFSMLNCCAPYGRIFHFGQEEAKKNEQLGLSLFSSYKSLYFSSPESITALSENEKKELQELITEGIKSGVVKPLPRVIATFEEVNKAQCKARARQNRVKTLVSVDTMRQNPSFVRFDTSSSYLVIGDETDVWVAVTEWLINREVGHIVISPRDHSKSSRLHLAQMKKHKNVLVSHHQDIQKVFEEAEKLGPVSAVYYINMDSPNVSKTLSSLDNYCRSPRTHLLALTRSRGSVEELCKERLERGFPSTNFIWDAEEMFINEHLEFMGKLCGKSSAIHVSPLSTLSKSDQKLIDLIPSTIDDFCDLGSSLGDRVQVTRLYTRAGTNPHATKEITPLIFVPGLCGAPLASLQPVVENYLYPVFCVQIPDMKLSMSTMASFILPEILKTTEGKIFNIVGVSWGTHLALELAQKLEELGATVGLILIGGPFLNPGALVSKSLKSDLLNLIEECFKTTTNVQLYSEEISENTWQGHLNRTLALLELPEDKEKDFRRAANFIYHNLQALIQHDLTTVHLKGPLTVILSKEHSFDEKNTWKLSKCICFRSLPMSSDELLISKDTWEIVHGSAVSQAMNESTIHECSWPALEKFMANQKLQQSAQSAKIKFSFVL